MNEIKIRILSVRYKIHKENKYTFKDVSRQSKWFLSSRMYGQACF
jgi:hypothetical protein